MIDVPWTRERFKDKPDQFFIKPVAIAEEAWHLTQQDRSAWSFKDSFARQSSSGHRHFTLTQAHVRDSRYGASPAGATGKRCARRAGKRLGGGPGDAMSAEQRKPLSEDLAGGYSSVLNPRRRWAWLVFLCRGTTSGTPSHQWSKLIPLQTWQCHLIFEMTGHIPQLWEDQAPGKESFRPA